MPLDDTDWTGIAVQDLPDGAAAHSGNRHTAHRARLTRFEYAILTAMGVLLLGAIAFASEDIFPDAGMIRRIAYGNAVADRNLTALVILAESHRLSFTVAGDHYEVDSPNRPLTQEEQQALLGYAEWKGLPRYSADGPLAVDP